MCVLQEHTLDKSNGTFYHGNKHILFMVKSNINNVYYARITYIHRYMHNENFYHGQWVTYAHHISYTLINNIKTYE